MVERVTYPANARLLQNQNPATDAVKKVTSRVNAQIRSLARAAAVVDGAAAAVAVEAILAVEATLAAAEVAVVVKNATSAGKSVTLHVTVPKAAEVVTAVEVGMVAGTATGAVAAAVAAVVVARLAILVAALVTCLVTVLRARSATTVSLSLIVLLSIVD